MDFTGDVTPHTEVVATSTTGGGPISFVLYILKINLYYMVIHLVYSFIVLPLFIYKVELVWKYLLYMYINLIYHVMGINVG